MSADRFILRHTWLRMIPWNENLCSEEGDLAGRGIMFLKERSAGGHEGRAQQRKCQAIQFIISPASPRRFLVAV